ncbi:YbhB/YbcL family Raf kinase inhibitor-like protein [Actinocrinis puniceicyclus]|uniref:YbhB/YbcL family Raf kinase inhibitor-like protein n=1 Tax=Actinocrinis puniceicyclus TaxID=977794 RepID=A0A8J7WKN6_9ACTN|nr:YbhB/YbcL family Raf kinase inhibitor-like protein [Actinocrinis puniceicyclus]MBS2964081.1 YbhB/YbcL family Raf kinase inhibitor-like protein [Actinocrinis puniceicyclus]
MRVLTSPRRWSRRTLISVAALVALVGAGGAGGAGSAAAAAATSSATAGAPGPARPTPFTLLSPDFRDGGPLPVWTEFGGQYAAEAGCYGRNLAPELNWVNPPAGTRSYALLVNDMDAPLSGGWHHWVVYDIPGAAHELEGHGVIQYTQGSTSWDVNGIPVVGWGGPCPPADGQTHHYIFTLYALSTATLPGDSLTYEQVLGAITPSVVGSTVIIGTFRLPLR